MDNIKKVQSTQLIILQEFMNLCKKHGLTWYMIGGSLIGVLRHQGFIPWDDDIDIGMPRDDYNKFLSLQEEFSEGYYLTSKENDKEWKFDFSQFVDAKSDIIVQMNEKPRKCHIWIDLFPIDGLPSSRIGRWFHMKHVLLYRYLVQIANIRTQVDTHKVGRPWYEKVILKICHFIPFHKLINDSACLDKLNHILGKYNFKDSSYVGNLLGKYREHEITKKEWWGEPVLKPFENMMVNVPADADSIETQIYGNYMVLPKPENRVSHDIEIINLRVNE